MRSWGRRKRARPTGQPTWACSATVTSSIASRAPARPSHLCAFRCHPRHRLLHHPRHRLLPRLPFLHVRDLEALLEALLEARAPIALLHQIPRRSESPGLLPAFWGVWAARSSAVCSPTSVTFANARRLQADVLPRMRSAMRHGARLRLAPKPTPMLYPSKWSRPLPVPR